MFNIKNKQSLPLRGKYGTIGIILTTVLLAAVAIFTAIRLYQTRSQPVAPNVPSSKPAAAGTMCGGIAGIKCPSGEVCVYTDGKTTSPFPDASGTCQVSADKSSSDISCSLSFVIATASPTPTPTASPSPSPTPSRSPSPSPTASPVPQCNTACTSNSQCLSGMTCYIPNGSTAGNCRKASCLTESNCVCATASPSPSPTPSRSPSPTPSASPSPTATASPTASPVAQCNSSCTSNSNCPSSMICYIPSGSTAGNCRNSQCLTETDCTCAVVTATPTITAGPTYLAEAPTDAPTLPEAGTSWPTLLGTGFGILVIIGSLLLAL